MASEVDICNLALAHLGDEASVSALSPPDGSAQAAHCARFYPIARDKLLTLHAWGFAVKRVALAQLGTPPASWAYQYVMPNDCLQPIAVLQSEDTGNGGRDGNRYETENYGGDVVVLTDVPTAYLRYTYKITDTNKFSAPFIDALAWLLAAYLAGPITKDPRVTESAYQMFSLAFADAVRADGRARHYVSDYVPSSIGARA